MPMATRQIELINARTRAELAAGNPVTSVDARKKALVGDCKNRGRTYPPEAQCARI